MSFSRNSLRVFLLTQDTSLLNLLRVLLSECGLETVSNSVPSEAALREYAKSRSEVCFIDVAGQTADGPGLRFARSLRQQNPQVPVVFIIASTAGSLYPLVSSFPQSSVMQRDLSKMKLLNAIRYATLQIENSQLSNRLLQLRDQQQGGQTTQAAPPPSSMGNESPQLFFKVGDSFRKFNKEEISFFYAENKMTYAKIGPRKYPTVVQLKTLEESLRSTFVRCHKKFIINMAHIEAIYPKEGKVKVGDKLLPIGYSYRKNLLSRLKLLR